MIPEGIVLVRVNEDWAEVRGWTKEPLVLTEASTVKSLRRTVEQKGTYEPERYQRRLDLYLGVMEQMGWALPEDLQKLVSPPVVSTDPVPAVSDPVAQPAVPLVEPAEPVAVPPVQIDAAFEAMVQREPPVPGPVKKEGPIHSGPARSWLDEVGEIPDPEVV